MNFGAGLPSMTPLYTRNTKWRSTDRALYFFLCRWLSPNAHKASGIRAASNRRLST